MRRRQISHVRFYLLLVVIAAALSAVASVFPVRSDPLRIGVSLGLSGRYEHIAKLQQQAYRLWEENVNRRGGILGRPVEIIIRDDHSEPETAKRIYESFISNREVDLLLGPYSSPQTAAVAPIVDKHRYPMLTPGAAAEEIWSQGYTHVFGMYSQAARYTLGFLAILAEARIERVAIVSVDDLFSLSAAKGARKWAPLHGLHVTSFQIEPVVNPDLTRAARVARDSGAQALLVTGHYNEAIQMRAIIRRLGWSPAAYYATVSPALQGYYQELGRDAHATFSTSIWEPRTDLRQPGSADFLRAFLAAYGEPPSYQAAAAYAACQILEQAIRRAGGVDRSAIRDVLASLDASSILGRFAVDRTGAQTKHYPLTIQWQGMKREIVWPPEQKTAEPIVPR